MSARIRTAQGRGDSEDQIRSRLMAKAPPLIADSLTAMRGMPQTAWTTTHEIGAETGPAPVFDAHAGSLALRHQFENLVAHMPGEGDDDFVDRMGLQNRAQLIGAAGH